MPRSRRRQAIGPAEIAAIKRFNRERMMERFRQLGPMPSASTPMLTTSQMMKFNIFDESASKKKKKSKRKTRTSRKSKSR